MYRGKVKILGTKHGFIDCLDVFVLYLRDVYFDRDLVTSEFDALSVGTEVLFDVTVDPQHCPVATALRQASSDFPGKKSRNGKGGGKGKGNSGRSRILSQGLLGTKLQWEYMHRLVELLENDPERFLNVLDHAPQHVRDVRLTNVSGEGIQGQATTHSVSFQNFSILDLAIAKASNHRTGKDSHWDFYLSAVRRMGELSVPTDLSHCFLDLNCSTFTADGPAIDVQQVEGSALAASFEAAEEAGLKTPAIFEELFRNGQSPSERSSTGFDIDDGIRHAGRFFVCPSIWTAYLEEVRSISKEFWGVPECLERMERVPIQNRSCVSEVASAAALLQATSEAQIRSLSVIGVKSDFFIHHASFSTEDLRVPVYRDGRDGASLSYS